MKKTVSLLFLLSSLMLNAQTVDKPTEPERKWNFYFSGSLSISTGDNFKQNTYPSIELGMCFKNMSFGFNMGRMNLDKSPFSCERLDNYYYEIKTCAFFPLGGIKGYVIGGWGGYYNSNHNFIEYGVGIVRSFKKIDLTLQASNWDRIVYLSPGIAYNF